jgi:hypothetical protein
MVIVFKQLPSAQYQIVSSIARPLELPTHN